MRVLRLVTAQGQRLRLRKRDNAFRQRGLGFPAQIVERETPLDRRGAQSCLRDHIVKSDAFMNQLGQRPRFLQRREILPLQILDGGNPQRVVLGEVVAYLDRDREILGQFAALLQQAQRLETPRAADDLEPLLLSFALHRTDDKVMQDPIGPDAGGKTLDGLAVDLPARVRGGWL